MKKIIYIILLALFVSFIIAGMQKEKTTKTPELKSPRTEKYIYSPSVDEYCSINECKG